LLAVSVVAFGVSVAAKQPAGPRQADRLPATIDRSATAKKHLLNIPDRKHAMNRPKGVGWCGESATQGALLFHGAYFFQKAINQAGKPQHGDLYANEIPTALRNLGMDIQAWPWRTVKMPLFTQWLRGRIASSVPVVTGMKIYPTKHPSWGLDHFVLAIGFQGDSVVFNTTWQLQQTFRSHRSSSSRPRRGSR